MSSIEVPKWEMPKDRYPSIDKMQGWESPINTFCQEMQMQLEDDMLKVVQSYGINVNKEELVKALQYDREQYSTGYKNGYNKAIDDCLKIITVCCWKNTEMIEELVEKLKGDNNE